MTILFISHSSEIGGAENVLYRLIKFLPKDKFKAVCIFPGQGPLKEKIRSLGIPTYICPLKWWVNDSQHSLINLFHFCEGLKDRVENIKRIIHEHDIDLVMTNTIVVGDGAVAAKAMGIPHVWRVAELLKNDPSLIAPVNLELIS